MNDFWVSLKTKEFWINFGVYFLLLSVVVGLVSVFMFNGSFFGGVLFIRLIVAKLDDYTPNKNEDGNKY